MTATSEPTHVSGSLTSKAALLIWSKGLSRMVAKDGITVNCISPGYLMTDQIRNNFIPQFVPTEKEQADWLDREIPMGRFGDPATRPTSLPSSARPWPATSRASGSTWTVAGTATSESLTLTQRAREVIRLT